MQPLIEEYESRGLLVITVAGDSDEQVRKFWKENELGITVLSDADYSIATSFGIQGFPTGFFIDTEGRIVDENVGWGPSSLKGWAERADRMLLQ
ncbi:MAG: TlpA family protein disulfide reductase [Firmicutes bacterium]|nr:TlpA family protein disulfide reductase [Bacillota bacterium]